MPPKPMTKEREQDLRRRSAKENDRIWPPELEDIWHALDEARAALLNARGVSFYNELQHARRDVDMLREMLQWCSGADDFQEGGKAHAGWKTGPARALVDTDPRRCAYQLPEPTPAAASQATTDVPDLPLTTNDLALIRAWTEEPIPSMGKAWARRLLGALEAHVNELAMVRTSRRQALELLEEYLGGKHAEWRVRIREFLRTEGA